MKIDSNIIMEIASDKIENPLNLIASALVNIGITLSNMNMELSTIRSSVERYGSDTIQEKISFSIENLNSTLQTSYVTSSDISMLNNTVERLTSAIQSLKL